MHRVIITIIFTIQCLGYYSAIIAATGNNGFILPANSFLTNVSPVINSVGDIAFNAMIPGNQGVVSAIFYKSNIEKEVKFYTALEEGVFVTDLGLTDKSVVSFGTHDGGQSRGIYTYDISNNNLSLLKKPERETYALSSLGVNDVGSFAYRQIDDKGEFAHKRRLIVNDEKSERMIFSDNDGKSSYLFSHVLAGNNILFKARYGDPGQIEDSRPDRLWLYNTILKRFTLVAQDIDANPSSKIISIENQYSLSNNGMIAFFARTKEGTQLFVSSDIGFKVILTEGIEIKNFDRFSPSINNSGEVLLRGEGLNGLKSLFLYKNNKWSSVINEGDSLSIIGQDYKLTNSRGITFIGRPMLSNNSEIIFNSLLKHTSSGEVVEAIVKLEND